MKEMNREEKIEKIEDVLSTALPPPLHQWHEDHTKIAINIIDAIEPPKIKVGMIGKFWHHAHGPMYGLLVNYHPESNEPFESSSDSYSNFQPMTPDEIKKELEEMQNERI